MVLFSACLENRGSFGFEMGVIVGAVEFNIEIKVGNTYIATTALIPIERTVGEIIAC